LIRRALAVAAVKTVIKRQSCRVVASIALAALVLVSGCGRDEEAPAPEVRPVRVLKTEKGEIGERVSLTGTVEAEREIDLSFRIDGQVSKCRQLRSTWSCSGEMVWQSGHVNVVPACSVNHTCTTFAASSSSTRVTSQGRATPRIVAYSARSSMQVLE